MLNIEYGSYQKLYDKYGEDFIYDPDMYFNNTYDEKWITSDIARKIIKDIDKSEVLGDNCVKWLLQMAEEKDIFIRLLHNMNFGTAFTIKVMNTNQVVHTMPELIQINSDILRGRR